MLSDGKTKLTHGSTPFIHGKTELTHGRTPLIHDKTKLTQGKTKKTSWSAAAQRLLRALQMVCRVTVMHCLLRNRHVEYSVPYLELMMFCRACGSLVDQNANFCKDCSKGTFLNLKYTYLHLF